MAAYIRSRADECAPIQDYAFCLCHENLQVFVLLIECQSCLSIREHVFKIASRDDRRRKGVLYRFERIKLLDITP
ncbi:hypothetical protein A5775_07685 [Mycobacterium sp. 852002-10029_SCH5224772]|nr:hypothetical protein A5775_07685 [Mycobacterium sp. 852002-10029_SCH5224772]